MSSTPSPEPRASARADLRPHRAPRRAMPLIILAMMASLCTALTGCCNTCVERAGQVHREQKQQQAARDAAMYVNSVVSADGTFRVRYSTRPNPVPLNELFTITALVEKTADGERASGCTITADAAMPGHGHGMNTQPQVTQRRDNTYFVQGMLFHMPGHWELYFDVTCGGVTERAQVDIELE